ncbi:MAG: 16S rRNA (uracil(1498)-N(3))-methyltransferase [Candidatus Binatia bacterium]
MNLVLLEPGELNGTRAQVGGRRAGHIATIHRATVGKQLRVGVIGGKVGTGVVVSVSPDAVVLDTQLEDAPPPPLACTLALALPRPRVLHRVLGAATAFGIKRIALFGSRRVEKSYWQSPVLGDESIRDQLIDGLEQSCDTMLPVVEKHLRFRPFVEDVLGTLAGDSLRLVADPGGAEPCPSAGGEAVTLVVGPEGGFVDYELGLLRTAGFRAVTLGVRPLRVEQAFAALVGRLF